MNEVSPIMDGQKIKAMKDAMKDENNYRDLLLFTFGINTGLRISDILSMKWYLLLDNTGRILSPKDRVTIQEKKTGKLKIFVMNNSINKTAQMYYESLNVPSKDDYIFSSRKKNKDQTQSISRQHAWRQLNYYAKKVGIKDKIGTHTLRKTFGYHLYKKGVTIEYIQKMLNHSAPSVTLRYIGITQEKLDEIYVDLNL